MENKGIVDLMEQKAKHFTFVSLNSPIVKKLVFPVLKQYRLKMEFYTKDGIINKDNHLTPDKETVFNTKMHFQIYGKRKDLKKFCEENDLYY